MTLLHSDLPWVRGFRPSTPSISGAGTSQSISSRSLQPKWESPRAVSHLRGSSWDCVQQGARERHRAGLILPSKRMDTHSPSSPLTHAGVGGTSPPPRTHTSDGRSPPSHDLCRGPALA
ncbi:zinc finger RNA-binding protein [Platysternon megacephalum]|uniref:Zinc finger RNA-binding protein n=1 Tax=Platysternon megacephalum TaxID=55544 RepID=A0A4D9EYM4_9SAUR|nr:zinc finger RNA-binding protein [Platysternon megacephalum]